MSWLTIPWTSKPEPIPGDDIVVIFAPDRLLVLLRRIHKQREHVTNTTPLTFNPCALPWMIPAEAGIHRS
jgi:hypothetical protein